MRRANEEVHLSLTKQRKETKRVKAKAAKIVQIRYFNYLAWGVRSPRHFIFIFPLFLLYVVQDRQHRQSKE